MCNVKFAISFFKTIKYTSASLHLYVCCVWLLCCICSEPKRQNQSGNQYRKLHFICVPNYSSIKKIAILVMSIFRHVISPFFSFFFITFLFSALVKTQWRWNNAKTLYYLSELYFLRLGQLFKETFAMAK